MKFFTLTLLLCLLFFSNAIGQFGIGGQVAYHQHKYGGSKYLSAGGQIQFPVLQKEFMIRISASVANYKAKESMNAIISSQFYDDVVPVKGESKSEVVITALEVKKHFSKRDTLSGGYVVVGWGLTFGTVQFEIDDFDYETMSIGSEEGRPVKCIESYARMGGGYDFKVGKNLKVFGEAGVSIPTTITIRTSTTVGPLHCFTGFSFAQAGLCFFF